MAWNQSELDFFSRALGMTITPEMAYGTLPTNLNFSGDYGGKPYTLGPWTTTSDGGGYNPEVPLSDAEWKRYQDALARVSTNGPIIRLTDNYHAGTTDILDPSQIRYDPEVGLYTTNANMKQYEQTDWGLYLMLAAMGGLAAAGSGLLGPAAQAAVTGAEASGMATQAAMLAEQYAGMGLSAEQAAQMAAADIAGGTSGMGSIMANNALGAIAATGGTSGIVGGAGGGILGSGITGSQALTGAGIASRLIGGSQGGTSRSGGGGFDLGGMITGGANLAYQMGLGDQAVQEARNLAPSMQFTPYSISSGMGRTYVDPATGEMKSELAPEWQQAQGTLLDSFYGNMQYATMDPMMASQYAYNMGSNLNAYQDEQNRLGLENRLLSQGMLGSTGGANQMRALYDSMNQRDLAREAQSLGLGQQLLNNYQQRGLAAYQPAWNTQTQFANQIGQSGQLGGQAMQGSTNAANLINQANLGRMKMNSTAATSFANNPALSGGINNMFSGAGNLLSGLGNMNWGSDSWNWNPATSYDNTWTSTGNFDPNTYDFQIWD